LWQYERLDRSAIFSDVRLPRDSHALMRRRGATTVRMHRRGFPDVFLRSMGWHVRCSRALRCSGCLRGGTPTAYLSSHAYSSFCFASSFFRAWLSARASLAVSSFFALLFLIFSFSFRAFA